MKNGNFSVSKITTMKRLFLTLAILFLSHSIVAQDLSGRDKQGGKDGKKAFSKGDYETAAKAYGVTSDNFRKSNPKAQYEYLYACLLTNRIMRASEEIQSDFAMKGSKKLLTNEELIAQITDLAGQYEYAIEEGHAHLKSGNGKLAIESADFAIDIDPYHLAGHLLRGRAFLLLEKWVDATASIQDIIDANIPEEQAFYIRAVAKMGQGDTSGALEDLNTSIKIRPSAEANYLRGSNFVAMNQGRRGINDLFTAIRLQPDFIAANYLMGQVQLDEADFVKALEYLTKTIAIDPDYKDAHYLRGLANARLGNFGDSRVDFNQQLLKTPKNAATHFELGKLYALPVFDTVLNRNDKALHHFDQALLADPHNDKYFAARAQFKSQAGNTNGAAQDYKKAIAIHPTAFEYYESRLQSQRTGKVAAGERIKGLKEAITVFQQETQKPRKGPGFTNLSKVYLLMHEEGASGSWLDSALVAVDEALKESQRNAEYFHQKGMVYKKGYKNYGEAEAFLKKAVDIDPKSEIYWLDLATVIYLQGDVRKAIETLKSGIKKVTNPQKSQEKLGEWCAKHPGDC